MRRTVRVLLAATLASASLTSSLPAAAEGPAMLKTMNARVEAGVGAVNEAYQQASWYADPPAERSGPPIPARIVRRGSRASGAVALTFDDGYNVGACARIARTLRKHGAVGTFFVNGSILRKDPDRWRRILKGMPVGNHTRSHPYLSRVSRSTVRAEIRNNEAIHERVLGRPMLKILRPSYGVYGGRVRRVATQLGYEHLAMWSVDTKDWKPGTTARVIARRATRARPGSIILMHCARDATARAMPAIIRHYQARGIRLAGLDEVIGAPRPLGHDTPGERTGGS
jgi:peptidoglycan/xylan/chitin deacetylase (PgdA/CDA1 family)